MKHTSDSVRMWKTVRSQSSNGTKTIEYRAGYRPQRDFLDGTLRKFWERPSVTGVLFILRTWTRFTKLATGRARDWIGTVSRGIETTQRKVRSSTTSGTTQFYMMTPEN